MILVIGATGLLGSEIVRQLRSSGQPVRALARTTSNPARIEAVKRTGADLIFGDLKESESIGAAVHGVDTIIATASSTISHQSGDTIETVDRGGYFGLIDSAKRAGVRRFVYTSIPPETKYPSPLTHAKADVADRLSRSGLEYTILEANFFMEVWLSPILGFDPQNARVTIYGTGDRPIRFVSSKNVAEVAVQTVGLEASRNRAISVGGPENLTPLEIVQIFERFAGRKFSVNRVTEEALLEQHRSATNPLEESFTALMLDYANGCPMDMKETRSMFPIDFISVQQYAKSFIAAQGAHA